MPKVVTECFETNAHAVQSVVCTHAADAKARFHRPLTPSTICEIPLTYGLALVGLSRAAANFASVLAAAAAGLEARMGFARRCSSIM